MCRAWLVSRELTGSWASLLLLSRSRLVENCRRYFILAHVYISVVSRVRRLPSTIFTLMASVTD